ncbi:hypothetical protein FDP41_011292 [Naegleria fowleri]|uniref:Carboxypeptidase n=1 Tax=Naegleria fowleri TaxID=5763 RepID=A0A6A5C6A2_NAEFO|nr:uncharacterized protein FDP41_011292 [Naegleria fowleri]KAF0982362.1 hypothetical protein FDP41_011292 [Naegleria fowleri]
MLKAQLCLLIGVLLVLVACLSSTQAKSFFELSRISKRQAGPATRKNPTPNKTLQNAPRVNLKEIDNPFKYSGFIEVNSTYGGQMYYVFMEALNGDENAPLIIWKVASVSACCCLFSNDDIRFQGGPGSSSMFGLFVENGPYLVDPSTLELVKNKYTWLEDHHMIWIDNPIGAGFSHVKANGYVHSEERVAMELHIFLSKFFQLSFASKYKKNPLYLFGESYAGKYVGLLDDKQRRKTLEYQNQIVSFIQAGRYSQAMDVYNNMTDYVITNCTGGFNQFDIRNYFDNENDAYIKNVELPHVKQMMHTFGVKYYDSSQDVWNALYADICQSARYQIEALLDCPIQKIRVLLYNGQYDWLINYMGAAKWIDGMEWHGSKEYLNDEGPGRKPWKIDHQVVGYVHQFDNLIQLVVNGAGHLSPMDQPKNVLEMVKIFTSGRDF